MSLDYRQFENIEVKLVGAISQPYELAVASARTCYSGKGIIYPNEVSKDEKAIELRDKIAASTLDAGHLTTRQHAHFVFAISGVSRQFIWSFLHSHPYYNSEQVSQRYVKVKPNNYLIPPLAEKERDLFTETVKLQTETYEQLIQILRPSIEEEYYTRFKSRRKDAKKWDPIVNKRTYEVARYILGVGTTAYLYHTVSALTLMRYAKLCNLMETSHEQRVVIELMLSEVKKQDPLFEKELSDSTPLEKTLEYQYWQKNKENIDAERFATEFDAQLEGKYSKLISYDPNCEKVLAQSIRLTLGNLNLTDEQAIELVCDPKNNPEISDPLNATYLEKMNQALQHVHFTFAKKISHTADSQDQRHRTVTSSRPLLFFHYHGKPDFITPYGIQAVPQAMELYQSTLEKSYQTINQLIDSGVSKEFAFYLLPNAHSIRLISTGNLLSYLHKWKLRSCYNAQEEIFRATIDELEQVQKLFPTMTQHLRAPCYLRLRASQTPYCPEGDHFCGLPVWKYGISDYQRKSL